MILSRAQRLAVLMLLAGAVPASPAWAYTAHWYGGSGTFSFARYDQDDNLIDSHWRTGPYDDKGPVPGPYNLAVFDHSLPNSPVQQVRFDRNVDNNSLKIHNGTVEFRIRNSDTQENHIYNLAATDATYNHPLLELANEDNESAIMKVTAGKLISSIGYDNDQGYSLLAYAGSGASATAIVTGQNATWIGGKVLVGREGTGAVRVENGGTLSISSFTVGRGVVRIKEGGTVSTGYATIGSSRGHEGEAFLVGEDASWSNGGIQVGSRGHGTLAIREGATMTSSGDVFISDGDRYAESVTAEGDVSVTGQGSTWSIASAGDSGSRFYIGDLGEGTLTISDGGHVLSTVADSQGFDDRIHTYVGGSDDQSSNTGTGDITVTGAGSLWKNDELDLGYGGKGGEGTITVSDGGRFVIKHYVYLGSEEGSSGTMVVTGQNSTVDVADDGRGALIVGSKGQGTLTVSNGAQVHTGAAGFGGTLDAVAGNQATITGAGSTWTVDEGIGIRKGTLRIEDGGKVVTHQSYSLNDVPDVQIGQYRGNTGSIVVSGADSVFDQQAGRLFVGRQGEGHLRIEEGGTVHTGGQATLARTDTASASVTVTGPDSTWTVDGSMQIAPYYDSNQATLRVEDGGNVTVGSETDSQGNTIRSLTVSSGGAIALSHGQVTSDALTVFEGGTVRGVGTLNVADSFTNEGTIAPGFSPGTITIDGDWAQSGTGSLVMEIAGLTDGQFDLLDITGDATLGGTLKLKFIDGFAPEDGDVFDLLTAGGTLDGDFDTINVAGLEPGWQYQTASEQGTFRLTSITDGTAVPEPATWMVLGLGAFGTLMRRRLRRCA